MAFSEIPGVLFKYTRMYSNKMKKDMKSKKQYSVDPSPE